MESENSFPDPFPIPETDEELLSQCRVETFMSGGKGGQHQNRTESGVRLVHLPTGLVTSSLARSRECGRLALGGRPIREHASAAFDEIDFGRWEGLTREEI